MPFRGDAPLGTQGGQDTPDLLQVPVDIRIAVGGTYIAYLLVNGPLTVRQRAAIETVVRTLGAKGQTAVVIVAREDGAIIETEVQEINYGTGIKATSAAPGVVYIEIAAGAVSASMLADAIITAGKIANGAVGNTQLADGSVTSAKIVDGTIATADIADLAITNEKLAIGSVSADELAASAVIFGKVALGAIAGTNIVDGSIGTSKILDNAVTLAKMADSSIGSTEIIDRSIQAIDIALGAVNSGEIADNAVGNQHYQDRSIDSIHLALTAARPEVLLTFVTPATGLAAGAVVATHSYTPPVGSAFRFVSFGVLQAEGSATIGIGSLRCDWLSPGTAVAATYEQGVDTSHMAVQSASLGSAAGTPINFELEWVRTSGTLNTKSGFLITIIWPYA